jgi:hypothetical protein
MDQERQSGDRMTHNRLEKHIERGFERDFVTENALKTHNFDKFWFHFLSAAVLLVKVISVGTVLFFNK